MLAAKARQEVAFGMQIQTPDAARRFGIEVNPQKTRSTPFTPKKGDRVIVLAEDDG